ncbi:hypothetical protein ACU8L2_31280 (plasmid) [Rhizobium leguminosarum]
MARSTNSSWPADLRLIDSQIGLTLDLIKMAYRSRAKAESDRKKAIQFIADQNVGGPKNKSLHGFPCRPLSSSPSIRAAPAPC